MSLKIDASHLKRFIPRGEQSRIATRLNTSVQYVNQVLHGYRYNEKVMDELYRAALAGQSRIEKINSLRNR